MNPHAPIHRRRSQGFTIMECMVMLPIMAVFLMMAGQLFVACLHTFSNADLRATRMSQRRGLMRELRQDVATAPKLQLQGAHGLICRFGKKRFILWLVNANGTVARMWQNGKNSPRPRYWPALLPDFHFTQSADGNISICWMHGKQRVSQTLDSPLVLADSEKAGGL